MEVINMVGSGELGCELELSTVLDAIEAWADDWTAAESTAL